MTKTTNSQKSPKKTAKALKRPITEVSGEENEPLPAKRISDEPIPKKIKWINKQRVLIFASRGISFRDRHLMEDLKKIMPHHKTEPKMERSKTLSVINEMCEMKNCTKAILFEGRRKRDLYVWMANIPNGPSAKFLIENVYTMSELKLTGNCLKGSRPLLSFDPSFGDKPHYKLLKELLTQIFGVPNHHPKSQPFIDHVYTFTVLDNRIWFRNFQILSEDGALAEVGPRFVLNPVKIFSGSFGGVPLWENNYYQSPAKFRNRMKLAGKDKYVNRQEQKLSAEARKQDVTYTLTPLNDIFAGNVMEKAQSLTEKSQEESQEEPQEEEVETVSVMQRMKMDKEANEKTKSPVKKAPKKNKKVISSKIVSKKNKVK